jgi:hypothetical protein
MRIIAAFVFGDIGDTMPTITFCSKAMASPPGRNPYRHSILQDVQGSPGRSGIERAPRLPIRSS